MMLNPKAWNWKTIAMAGIVIAAYLACKFFKINEPSWLDQAVAVIGIGVLAYMQSAAGPPAPPTPPSVTP